MILNEKLFLVHKIAYDSFKLTYKIQLSTSYQNRLLPVFTITKIIWKTHQNDNTALMLYKLNEN